MNRPALTAQEARAAIRRRAWELMRSVYKYPAIPYASIGRRCLRWCIEKAVHEMKHGTEAERFEREAAELAEKHGYSVSALHYHMMRYSFGSLSTTLGAQRKVDLYARAMNIAARHEPVELLQAAE